ncbi:MAG: hypothetical protein M3Z21_07590 [Pseudomonadota bacterium]|nr:hypothetical protein [Pseudomonadota bacterium]
MRHPATALAAALMAGLCAAQAAAVCIPVHGKITLTPVADCAEVIAEFGDALDGLTLVSGTDQACLPLACFRFEVRGSQFSGRGATVFTREPVMGFPAAGPVITDTPLKLTQAGSTGCFFTARSRLDLGNKGVILTAEAGNLAADGSLADVLKVISITDSRVNTGGQGTLFTHGNIADSLSLEGELCR